MVSKIFWFCFNPSVTEKLKNLISEIPVIPQTLIINNYRSASAKSISSDVIRKHIEYSGESMSTLTFSEILLFRRKVGIFTRPTGYRERKGWTSQSLVVYSCDGYKLRYLFSTGLKWRWFITVYYSLRLSVERICFVFRVVWNIQTKGD